LLENRLHRTEADAQFVCASAVERFQPSVSNLQSSAKWKPGDMRHVKKKCEKSSSWRRSMHMCARGGEKKAYYLLSLQIHFLHVFATARRLRIKVTSALETHTHASSRTRMHRMSRATAQIKLKNRKFHLPKKA